MRAVNPRTVAHTLSAVILAALVATAASGQVVDSSFEQGDGWTQDTLCERIGNWRLAWRGLDAPDGELDLWVGGGCGFTVNLNSVWQTVSLPAGSNVVTFQYAVARFDDDDPAGDDELFVTVNGIDVWTLDVSSQSANTYHMQDSTVLPTGGFVTGEANLIGFGGQTVVLEIGIRSNQLDSGTASARIDLVELHTSDSDDVLLSVAKAGTGSGTVSSAPGGIDCGASCFGAYPAGTEVALDVEAAAGSVFAGWQGDVDCADGTVTVSSNISCTAIFELENALFVDGFENGGLDGWTVAG